MLRLMADDAPVATMHAVMLRWVESRLKADGPNETQETVAAHLGMPRPQLNQTRSGVVPKGSKSPRSFQIENIEHAAASLGVSLGEFLHTLGSLAVEIDTEERVSGQPVDGGGPRTVRVLADPETAARLRQPDAAPPKPSRKPRK